jgi:hypothetical protein
MPSFPEEGVEWEVFTIQYNYGDKKFWIDYTGTNPEIMRSYPKNFIF